MKVTKVTFDFGQELDFDQAISKVKVHMLKY